MLFAMTTQRTPTTELQQIVESAQRLGVEMDEAEALQWLSALSATKSDDRVVFDHRAGVFGHRVTMLDFSAEDLNFFREVGKLVEIPDEEGVETALALSGSAAQSKIQSYPGDCDYFERVNIKADSKKEAGRIIGRIIRQKALAKERGENYQLIGVRFGSYPFDIIRNGKLYTAGSSIEWYSADLQAGAINGESADGDPLTIAWYDVADEPGWCKLDWVIADPVRKKLSNASNMLDVTWEAPDGTITPLDGYLDPYFQEVYLEAESIPLFAKLAQHVSADALDSYVDQLEGEVAKYVAKSPNYGKAAKRMYNIFRLQGRYYEAIFLRELFDEPATVLYQVWSLIRTLDEAMMPNSGIKLATVHDQADELIMSVVTALSGEIEHEMVRLLLRLRRALGQRHQDREAWITAVDSSRAEIINVVNNYFHDKLVAVPTIRDYMEQFQEA